MLLINLSCFLLHPLFRFMIDFEQFKLFLQDFNMFLNLIDTKMLIAMFREAKIWEWKVADKELKVSLPMDVRSEDLLKDSLLYDDDSSIATGLKNMGRRFICNSIGSLCLTLRGFIELLLKISVIFSDKLDSGDFHTLRRSNSPSSYSTSSKRESQFSQATSNLVAMLRWMDKSGGKQKVAASPSRSGSGIRKFIFE